MKSQVCDKGGVKPIFNEEFTLAIESMNDDIRFIIYDNRLLGDKEVGSTFFKVSRLCTTKGFN